MTFSFLTAGPARKAQQSVSTSLFPTAALTAIATHPRLPNLPTTRTKTETEKVRRAREELERYANYEAGRLRRRLRRGREHPPIPSPSSVWAARRCGGSDLEDTLSQGGCTALEATLVGGGSLLVLCRTGGESKHEKGRANVLVSINGKVNVVGYLLLLLLLLMATIPISHGAWCSFYALINQSINLGPTVFLHATPSNDCLQRQQQQ